MDRILDEENDPINELSKQNASELFNTNFSVYIVGITSKNKEDGFDNISFYKIV